MSTRSIAGIAGGAIGFLIAGPAGFAFGAAIGGIIGGIIDPQIIHGPRLKPDDLRIQVSTYGQVIPWCWGWVRVAGNMVWATDIIEETSKKKSGIGTKTKKYSYFGNFTLIFCKSPVSFVRRIWADGKLIYEADPDTGTVTSKYGANIKFRFGDEDQGPSPLHERYDGVDAGPNMRGVAGIDFDYLPLADFSNHIPTINVELFAGEAELPLHFKSTGTLDQAQNEWNGTTGATTEYWFDLSYSYNFPGFIDYGTQERIHQRMNARLYGDVPPPHLDPFHPAQTLNEGTYNASYWSHLSADGSGSTYAEPYAQHEIGGLIRGEGARLMDHALHRPSAPDTAWMMLAEDSFGEECRIIQFDRTLGEWKATVDSTRADTPHIERLYSICFDDNDNLICYGDNLDSGQTNVDFIQVRSSVAPFGLLNGASGMGFGYPDDGSDGQPNVPSFLAGHPYKQRIPNNKILFVGNFTGSTYGRHADNGVLAYTVDLGTGAIAYIDNLWDPGTGGPYDEPKSKHLGETTVVVAERPRWQAIYYDPWNDKITLIWRVPGEFSTFQPFNNDRQYVEWVYATMDGDLTGYQYHGYMPWSGMRDADDNRVTDPLNATVCRTRGGTMSEPQRHQHSEQFGVGVSQMQMAWSFRLGDCAGGIIDLTYNVSPSLRCEVLICDYANGCQSVQTISDNVVPHPLGFDDAASYDLTLYNLIRPSGDIQNTNHKTSVYWHPTAGVLSGENTVDSFANFYTSEGVTTSGIDPSLTPGAYWEQNEITPWYYLRMSSSDVADCIPLSQIVSDICLGAGMLSSEFSVSVLAADCVTGYKVGQQVSARQMIEPLQDAYFFDGIETGGQLIYKYRDGSILEDIPESMFGARGENDTPIPPIRSIRQQEIELPQRVFVRYEDYDQEYNTLTQQDFRSNETQNAEREVTVDLPVVMTSAKAKEVASQHLALAWQLRTTYEFSLPRSYAHLDPGDIITATIENVFYTIYITEIDAGANGLLRFKGVSHASSVYKPSPLLPAQSSFPPQGVVSASDAVRAFIDGPLLRDIDDVPGFYMAAEGTDTNSVWPGGTVYRSLDDAVYDEYANIGSAAVLGSVPSVLPDHSHCYMDRTNTIQVNIGDQGELTSTTWRGITSGENYAMIGDELIQFEKATLVSSGVYDLTNIMRGRQGTSWASGTHGANEQFVLVIEADLVLADATLAEIDTTRYYKVVTDGQDITAISGLTHTNESNRLRPLAPAHLRGDRDGSNNLDITWRRLQRVGSTAWTQATLALDETSETYELEIMNGAAVVRTVIGLTSPSYQYTEADQIVDFGSAQSSVTVRVYQISSRVGRGYVMERDI